MFGDNVKSTIKQQLHSTPLGRWIGSSHQKWQYFLDPKTGISHSFTTPSDSYVAIDIDNENNTRPIAMKPQALPPIPQILPITPTQAVSQAPTWIKQLWRTTRWTKKLLDKILQHIDNGNLIAAGKGAVLNQWGSYAWCFAQKQVYTIVH